MLTLLDRARPKLRRVRWDAWLKVVRDHRTGEIHEGRTNAERAARGLPTPWHPDMAHADQESDPIF